MGFSLSALILTFRELTHIYPGKGTSSLSQVVMGNPIWDLRPLLEVAVHIVAETVTQPYFGFCCLQFHHHFNDNVL